ncbi:hypothetical protein GCM10010994_33240 [Chelatococcus reniformis]|uniref:DUF3313 domain-containing protein n=2 Tax=Chelatococcus reniformis TaxID=1494448 RepID=A0A916UGM8_9HYPH|nr:hypothetical protein GCM10010994_33240 [Chelatococcus reniformis]
MVAVALAAAVAACVTVTNPATREQVLTYRLTRVDVVYAGDAKIWWGDGEREFAATKGVAAHNAESVANTPEGQAYLRGAISHKLEAAFERALAPYLVGERPVRLQVVVKGVRISSVIQRIVIGGNHAIAADINLVDAKTGEVLIAFAGQGASVPAGQGIVGTMVDHALMAAPIDRVIDNMAITYKNWLLKI